MYVLYAVLVWLYSCKGGVETLIWMDEGWVSCAAPAGWLAGWLAAGWLAAWLAGAAPPCT